MTQTIIQGKYKYKNAMHSTILACMRNLLPTLIVFCFIFVTFRWDRAEPVNEIVQPGAPSRRSLPEETQHQSPPSLILQYQSKRLDRFLNHLYINETMWNNPDPTYEELQTWWGYHSRPDIPGIWTVRNPSDGGLEIYLWGTKYAQRKLFEFQNPTDCTGKKFLMWGGWPSGIGSVINVLSQAFACSVNMGRIFVLDPGFQPWGDKSYCEEGTIQCYFHQLSHCIPQPSSDVLKLSGLLDCPFQAIPDILDSIVDGSPLKDSVKFYWWRAQSMTYFLRPTSKFIDRISQNRNLVYSPGLAPKKSLPSGTIGIHIRRADGKQRDMVLWPTSYFLSTVRILRAQVLCQFSMSRSAPYQSLPVLPRPHSATSPLWPTLSVEPSAVFLSTDDASVITDFALSEKRLIYLNVSRPVRTNFEQALALGAPDFFDSFLNLHMQLQCDCFVGTLRSNWNRLIDSLRMTVSGRAHVPHIDLTACFGDKDRVPDIPVPLTCPEDQRNEKFGYILCDDIYPI